MDPNGLGPWRDLSILWLGLLTFIGVLVPGALFYFAQLYLRRFNRWLKMPLLNAQVWALRIQQTTARVSERVANVPIAMHSASAQYSTTLHGVINYVLGK